MRMALVDHWPLFGLRICTPRLELRYPDDALGCALVELAAKGIHEPGAHPFLVNWTDDPSSAHLQHLWRNRAEWSPDKWHCQLVALVDDDVVGTQGLTGEQFAIRRSVESGSWLGRAFQGRGLGKEMRAAILHLAFDGLGAEEATTGGWHDNAASLGVTRHLGYLPNGEERRVRGSGVDRLLRFRMPRSVWQEQRRDDIRVEGLRPCLELFGATS
jgi:RimJ/RimL family protein N-acetyltransferase